MAEDDRKPGENVRQQNRSQSAASADKEQAQKSEKTLKVELLAESWQQLADDGKTVVKRHRRGAELELPESVVKRVNGNGFKQAFRVLED